ncbi:MAG: hypothetical protein L3J08_05700 [Flavobacteriaceae bacterium]|nr:hypothetical protein [Flavobacteriaceae bacterium]
MKITILGLFLSLLTFGFIACNTNVKKENSTTSAEPSRSIETVETKFSSSLKPNETILLHKIYRDTIVFSEYNDGGDYLILFGKKNGNNVSLIYDREWTTNEKYSFKYGESIKIKWKMDSIFLVGDGGSLDFREHIIDAEKMIPENKQATIIFAKIDSISLSQIKQNEIINQSIFDFYKTETGDQVEIWSNKMFGRCCSNTDIRYSEILNFSITTNVSNKAYPASNLSDTQYRTAHAFKESQNIEIFLKLNLNSEHHLSMTNLSVDEILQENDTLLKPFKLSLVNGYVKSKETFEQNGRVKTIEVYLNNTYKGIVQLMDTPLVQEFSLDLLFTRDDTIKLVPKSYYAGSKYNDICISEIQNNLGAITHFSLNDKISLTGNSYSYTNYKGNYEYSNLGYNQIKIREGLKPVEKRIWKAYHHNYRLACKVEYYNGKLMNVISYFDKNGRILDKGSIKDGNGILKEYDEDGKLIKEITFKNGIIIE